MTKKKSKKVRNISIAIFTIALLISGYLIYSNFTTLFGGSTSFLTINLYDQDGNPIKGTQQSIVDGTEGVYYISFDVNVRNIGDVPLQNVRIKSAEPSQFYSALPTNSQSIQIDELVTFSSELMETLQFESDTYTTFSATLEGSYQVGDETRTLEKTGSINVLIQQDPSGDFEVTIGGSEDGDINPDCTENWQCTEWGACSSDGIQTRICDDLNQCGTTINQPSETQSCVPSQNVIFRTESLSYESHIWVAYGSGNNPLVGYGRTSGACTDKKCNTSPDLLVPSSLGNTRMWIRSPDICICSPEDNGFNVYSRRYSTSYSDAERAVLSKDPTPPYSEDGRELYS